jgi:hypothetical protein
MPNIRFIYENDDYKLSRETVVSKVCNIVSTFLDLPIEIQIRFANLGPSVYGNTALDNRFKNRISINTSLTDEEIVEILVHELIHLYQIHTGLLSVTRSGSYIWKKRSYKVDSYSFGDYKHYSQLPWELDVEQKQKPLLSDVRRYLEKNR